MRKFEHINLGIGIVFTLLATCFVIFSILDVGTKSASAGGFPVVGSMPCNTTSSVVQIGNQASTQLSASSSRRSFMQIEQPINATNTVSLSLSVSAAVSGSGPQLTPATSTSPVAIMMYGLNTDMNYIGPVQAITNSGSSTIVVTQCNF